MKAVMLSIQPKWVELIASGNKTVEVRKTKPKIDVPFKCYIYCTKDNSFAEKTLRGFDDNGKPIYYKASKGKVIGEFVCDSIFHYRYTKPFFYHGQKMYHTNEHCAKACLTWEELERCLGEKDGYGWHITDLVIYDKPKELSEFRSYNVSTYIDEEFGLPMPTHEIKRPFQSWGYVYEVDT